MSRIDIRKTSWEQDKIKDRYNPRSKHNQWKGEHQQSRRILRCSKSLSGNFRGQDPLRKVLGSKEHLDWLKLDLNAAQITTVEDYKRTKN